MSGADGFLTRWSRRKLEVERHQEPELPDQGTPEPSPPEAMLTEEEIALLPPIGELTPESDITGFLRNGVPAVLRRAALRRMWSLDPAIRDYVGDARDYAWNWNIPGDVPGNGPLLPSDDMAERIERMFSRATDPAEPDPEPTDAAAAQDGTEATQTAEFIAPSEAERLDEPSADGALAALPLLRPEEPDCAAADPEPAPVRQGSATLRRHGAAIPKFDRF